MLVVLLLDAVVAAGGASPRRLKVFLLVGTGANVLRVLLQDRFERPCLQELPITLGIFDTDARQLYLGTLAQLGLFACKMALATFRGELALFREAVTLRYMDEQRAEEVVLEATGRMERLTTR